MSVNLRDYQVKGVDDISTSLSENKKVCYQLATGGGKTHIMAKLITRMNNNPRVKGIMILSHRKRIIKQISERLNVFGVPHGIIAPWAEKTKHKIQVASVQTVYRRKLDTPFTVVVCDEAHNIMGKSWIQAIEKSGAKYVVGFTATPTRLDGQGLGDVFNALVHGPSMKDLMARGMLSKYKAYSPNPELATKVTFKTLAGEYSPSNAAEVMEEAMSVYGDPVDAWNRYAKGMKTIGFACTISHAEKLCAQYNEAGIVSEVLHSKLSADECDAAIKRFENGEITCLWTVDMVSEGFDIPDAECAVLMRPTKSVSLFLQQAGRVLRPHPNKEFAVIIDHACNTERHGLVDMDRKWVLAETEQRSRKFENPKSPVKVCPNCSYYNEPSCKECVDCGTLMIRERVVSHKKDVALRGHDDLSSIDGQAKEIPGWVERYRYYTYKDLLHEAKRKGRKPGWAFFFAKQLDEYGVHIQRMPYPVAEKYYNAIPE